MIIPHTALYTSTPLIRLQLRDQLVAGLQPFNSITDQLINNSLGRLLLVNDSGSLAHQERTRIVHGLIINLITELLEVVLDRDHTLGRQVLDLLLSVLLPVADVLVLADAHWATREDDGADVVVEAGRDNGVLVGLGRTSLVGDDEARSDPDGAGAEHEGCGQGLAVEDAAGGDDLDWLSGHGRRLALDELDNSGDENGGWDVAGVAASLATLGDDEIDTEIKALLHMLWVADHVHVENAICVEPLDDVLWWDTDGRDEDLCTALNNDINELVELALRVIVAAEVLVSIP